MASPKLKNLYLFSIASLYALNIKSFPAIALTNIINVDSGRWKFVISPSAILNAYPGYMNISVHPDPSLASPSSVAIVSSVLIEVVPTGITFPPL